MIKKLLFGCSLFAMNFLTFGQSFQWLKTGFRQDCSNGVYPRDVTSSPNGSVTSTGYFYAPSTTVDFDGQTLTQNGTGFSSDVFIANYDENGTIQWLEKIGTDQNDGTYPRIGTDGNNNIYVAADLAGTTGGSNGNAAGLALTNVYPNDAVLVKLNSSGNAIWAQHITDASGDVDIRDIDVAINGDTYLTGSFSGSISVDGTTQTADGDNFFVAKFDTDGNLMWWRNSTGANNDIGYRVTVKGSNVYVLGQMAQGNVNTTMTVNGITNTLNAGEDRAHFLVKYNDAGTFSWFEYGYLENTGFGSGIFPYYCDVAVDDNDNIYTIHNATAESQASADYIYPGTSVVYSTVANTSGNGKSNYIITKYNSSGVAQWARGDGTSTSGNIFPTEMILHSNGNLIVTNLFDETVEVDGNSFTSAGSEDMLITQFDLEAALVCSRQYGGANQDWAMALDENPDGTCAYAGHVFGGTSEAVITDYDGINLSGCRNTGITGAFSTTSVNANFSFVTYPSGDVCQPNANGLILSASPTGYTKTFISSPAGLSIDGSTGEIDVNNSAPGVYSVSHILSDGTPCGSDTVTQTFTINEAPSSTAGADFSVCGSTATLNGNIPNSGSGNWNISSGPAGANITDSSDPTSTINDLSEGTYTIEWSVTNSCGTDADEVVLTVNDLPTVTIGNDQTTCVDYEPIVLSGTPVGGSFSGTGVTASEFDPGVAGIGTHTVTYTYQDGDGCENSATQDFTVEGCASITEESSRIAVYPNPAGEFFFVEVTNGYENITIISALGQEVNEYSVQQLEINKAKVDMRNLSRGTYFVKVRTEGEVLIQKLIIR